MPKVMRKDAIDETLFKKAAELKKLYDEIEVLEAKLKILNADYGVKEAELAKKMREGQVPSFVYEPIGHVISIVRERPRILEGHEPEVHEWLRTCGRYDGVVKPYVHPNTLTKQLKEEAEKRSLSVKELVNKDLLGSMDVFVQPAIQFRS